MMELTQQQAQKQVLSQGLRRSLEVLQLPTTELEAYLQEAALSNPLLELELPQDARLPDPEQEPARDRAQREADTWEASGSESAALWDLPAGDGAFGGWEGAPPEDFTARLADPRGQGERLSDALGEQLLHMPRLTDELRRLCQYLIECLNENGFLEFDLADLAREQGVPLFDMEQALYILQDLQPAGVGARSLTECLVLQLARTDHFNPHTLRLVQTDGLELLAKGDLPAIARLLGCSQAAARQAAGAVRSLNPRPAQGYGTGGDLACQIPEAVFRREDGRVRIELDRRLLRKLSLNQQNCALLQSAGSERDRQYLREKKADAQQLIRAVQERDNTMVRLLEALADCQQGYFLRHEPLQPLTLTQLAERLGLSLSTVSRAVQGKCIQFEGRTLPLRRFFTAAITGADGAAVSSENVRRHIVRFVQAEDPTRPLSDEALRAALAAVQLPVSRRTVAKYREELGIPASSARRRAREG